MIQPAQKLYLEQVLGVKEILIPKNMKLPVSDHPAGEVAANPVEAFSEASGLASFEILQSSNANVGVLTNQDLTSGQLKLANNILRAVKVDNPVIVKIDELNVDLLKRVEGECSARWFIYFEEHFEKFYGTIEPLSESQVLYTYALDFMLQGPASEIQNFKKHVWQHMKMFSAKWENK